LTVAVRAAASSSPITMAKLGAARIGALELRLEVAAAGVHHHVEAGAAQALGHREGDRAGRLALVDDVDVARRRGLGLAALAHQLEQPLDADREAARRRGLAAEHLDERVVASAAADRALRAEPVGDPLEDRAL
jgi:hypothetical protein